jgi:hypothetical protein
VEKLAGQESIDRKYGFQKMSFRRTYPLTRIIHIFEDNKSLLCYKHVDKTMFEQQKRLLNV